MEERKTIPPIREGDELDVKIEAVGEKGDGIAKVKGFVLFVPNTKEGDSVKVRVTKVLRRVGFAEVIGEASEQGEEAPEEEKEDFEEEAPEDTEDFGEDTEEDSEEEEPVKKGRSSKGKKR